MRTPSSLLGLFGHEKVRFILVGGINTLIDFSVLYVLINFLGLPNIVANIISTTTALCASYLLNKKAVFGNTDTHNVKQLVLFVVVTLTGLWILQGAIIALLIPLLQPIVGKTFSLLVAKLIATAFSLTWNYLWYSRVVFRQHNVTKE